MMFRLSNLVIPPWVKICWRLAPYVVAALLAGALYLTRATLHEVRQNDKLVAAQSELASKSQELEWTQKLSAAQMEYLTTFKNLSSIMSKSDDETKAFAATPAGAVSCLTLDRVREISAHRSADEAASSSSRGTGTVQTSGDPTP